MNYVKFTHPDGSTHVWVNLEAVHAVNPSGEGKVTVHTPTFTVEVDNGVFFVFGREMDRLIESVNFDNEESLNWFHRSLRRLGVIDALRGEGAKEGDSVVIGDMEFDFVE